MCGRFSTSRRGCLQFSSGLCPPACDFGHSPEDNWSPIREVENLPHIRRPEPRRISTKNLYRYLSNHAAALSYLTSRKNCFRVAGETPTQYPCLNAYISMTVRQTPYLNHLRGEISMCSLRTTTSPRRFIRLKSAISSIRGMRSYPPISSNTLRRTKIP